MDVYIVTEDGQQSFTTLDERDANAMFDRVVRSGRFERAVLLRVPSIANDRIAIVREVHRDAFHGLHEVA